MHSNVHKFTFMYTYNHLVLVLFPASELGGKAAMIVFNDCDLQQAVNGAAFATFVASGQTCIMGARLVIHKDVYSKFLDMLTEKVSCAHSMHSDVDNKM